MISLSKHGHHHKRHHSKKDNNKEGGRSRKCILPGCDRPHCYRNLTSTGMRIYSQFCTGHACKAPGPPMAPETFCPNNTNGISTLCLQHQKCQEPNCYVRMPTLTIDQMPFFCHDHTCPAKPRCKNPRHSGQHHCPAHQCIGDNFRCPHQTISIYAPSRSASRVIPVRVCVHHKCDVRECALQQVAGGRCEKHQACIVKNCPKPREVIEQMGGGGGDIRLGLYCEDHKPCDVPSCPKIIAGPGKFCRDHECALVDCGRVRRGDKSMFCHLHKCYRPSCHQLALHNPEVEGEERGPRYCKEHECRHPACKQPKCMRRKGNYCEGHSCRDCGGLRAAAPRRSAYAEGGEDMYGLSSSSSDEEAEEDGDGFVHIRGGERSPAAIYCIAHECLSPGCRRRNGVKQHSSSRGGGGGDRGYCDLHACKRSKCEEPRVMSGAYAEEQLCGGHLGEWLGRVGDQEVIRDIEAWYTGQRDRLVEDLRRAERREARTRELEELARVRREEEEEAATFLGRRERMTELEARIASLRGSREDERVRVRVERARREEKEKEEKEKEEREKIIRAAKEEEEEKNKAEKRARERILREERDKEEEKRREEKRARDAILREERENEEERKRNEERQREQYMREARDKEERREKRKAELLRQQRAEDEERKREQERIVREARDEDARRAGEEERRMRIRQEEQERQRQEIREEEQKARRERDREVAEWEGRIKAEVEKERRQNTMLWSSGYAERRAEMEARARAEEEAAERARMAAEEVAAEEEDRQRRYAARRADETARRRDNFRRRVHREAWHHHGHGPGRSWSPPPMRRPSCGPDYYDCPEWD